MRVMLINPKLIFTKEVKYSVNSGVGRVWQPLDQAFMGSILEENNVDVKIVDCIASDINLQKLKEKINDFKPNFAAITSTNVDAWRCPPLNYDNVKNVLDIIPKGATSIVYGPHVSAFPVKIFNELKPDYSIMGEPEERVTNLILHGKDNVDGIVFKESGESIKKDPKTQVNLEKLPVPAYHLLPMDRYRCDSSLPNLQETPFVFTITSRGCPYQCVFCYKNVAGSKYRMRSLDILQEEFDLLEKKYKVKSIYFGDEIFNFLENRTNQVCELLSNYNFKFCCEMRADILHGLDKLKKAGCVLVDLGVESFNDKVLNNIKKGLDSNQIKTAISKLNEANIPMRLFMMVGLPGETKDTIKESVDSYIKSKPVSGGFPITTIFPDTELWDMAKKEGKIEGSSWKELQKLVGVVGNNFTKEEVKKIYEEVTAKTVNYSSLLKNNSKLKLIIGAIKNPSLGIKILKGILSRVLKRGA